MNLWNGPVVTYTGVIYNNPNNPNEKSNFYFPRETYVGGGFYTKHFLIYLFHDWILQNLSTKWNIGATIT